MRRAQVTTRRALTILEIVFAVVLLSLVTASVMGALASVQAVEVRDRQRLGAYELANRLVLQWLDDKHKMPPPGVPLDYGPFRYMWSKDDADQVRMTLNSRQGGVDAPSLQGLDRYREITIYVYIAEGDPAHPYAGEQLASLSRIYDPAAMRNPSAMWNFSQNQDENIAELLRIITGQSGGIPSGTTGAAGTGTPGGSTGGGTGGKK